MSRGLASNFVCLLYAKRNLDIKAKNTTFVRRGGSYYLILLNFNSNLIVSLIKLAF